MLVGTVGPLMRPRAPARRGGFGRRRLAHRSTGGSPVRPGRSSSATAPPKGGARAGCSPRSLRLGPGNLAGALGLEAGGEVGVCGDWLLPRASAAARAAEQARRSRRDGAPSSVFRDGRVQSERGRARTTRSVGPEARTGISVGSSRTLCAAADRAAATQGQGPTWAGRVGVQGDRGALSGHFAGHEGPGANRPWEAAAGRLVKAHSGPDAAARFARAPASVAIACGARGES